MSKARLHIYGKYMGDIKVIHDALEESNEYEMTYQYIDTGKGGKPLSDIDYLILSHQTPSWYKGKIIHAYHGLGCLTSPAWQSAPKMLADYKRQGYYALCMYGETHRSWFEGIGFPNERLLVIGMASSVELLSPINEQERDKFLLDKCLNSAKKTIMYAPTWDHGEDRGFFCLWWQDGREAGRVERFCRFVTCDLDMNLIVRLHEKKRYSQDWIKKYSNIFEIYKVSAHYFDDDPYNLPYFKCSDILVGDLSSVNTYFYVMDKPVVHIGVHPFKKKLRSMWACPTLSDRAGHVVEDFEEMLTLIKDSINNPARFRSERKRVVDKYVDHTGEDSKEAILSEFRRFLYNDREEQRI